MRRFLRFVSFAGAVLFCAYAMLATVAMRQMHIEHLIICSEDNGAYRLPHKLCEFYLTHFRINEEGVEELEGGQGISFLFGIEDKAQRARLLDQFIAAGADVNKPDHTTSISHEPLVLYPIHVAVLYNDAELLRYLIAKGAKLDVKGAGSELTPLELLKKMEHSILNDGLTEIREVLEQALANTPPP